jgi:hypothetical protein
LLKTSGWDQIRSLEHDPEKREPVSLDKREALARRSCPKQGDEITIRFNPMGS